jgi:hypothetical protein
MNSAHLPITTPDTPQKIQSNQRLKNNKDNKDKRGEELVSASSGTK